MAPESWGTVRIMAQLRRNHGDSSTQFSIGHTFARSIRRTLLCPKTTEQPTSGRLDACPDKSQRTRLEKKTTLRVIEPALSREQDSITRLQFRIFGRQRKFGFVSEQKQRKGWQSFQWVFGIDQQITDRQRGRNVRRQGFAQPGIGSEAIEDPHERNLVANARFQQVFRSGNQPADIAFQIPQVTDQQR